MAYTYFGNGTRKTVTDAEGLVTQYTYDGQNRLKTATTAFGRPEAATTTYTYWPDDLLKTVATPNGVVATHGYDKADRLTSLTNAKGGATVSRYAYTYDPNGNRLSQVEENGGLTETTTYTYDGLDRLATVTYPTDANYANGRVVSYGYDAVGNRARETERTTAGAILADKQGVFDNLNRLTSLADLVSPANSTTFTWDANGNQLTKTVGSGQPTEYRYDIRDKLVETVQGTSTLGRFQYDFQGRRNQKIGQDGVKQYVYDQTSVLAEYDAGRRPEGQVRLRLRPSDQPLPHRRRPALLPPRRPPLRRQPDGRRRLRRGQLPPDGLRRVPLPDGAGPQQEPLRVHRLRVGPGDGPLQRQGPLLRSASSAASSPRTPTSAKSTTPPSLHRYFYANDNPVRYVDPTGHAAKEQQQAPSWLVGAVAGGLEFFDRLSKVPAQLAQRVATLLTPGAPANKGRVAQKQRELLGVAKDAEQLSPRASRGLCRRYEDAGRRFRRRDSSCAGHGSAWPCEEGGRPHRSS